MSNELDQEIELKIAGTTGAVCRIVRSRPASGGCINDARIVELEDGGRFFVKSNAQSPASMFEKEAVGLLAIAKTQTIRVPSVIGWQDGNSAFLILEVIESAPQCATFFEDFGRRLASMHSANQVQESGSVESKSEFGFDHDNFIGSTPQPNAWDQDWISFWQQNRFGYQVKLARDNGYADETFQRLADKLNRRLADFLTVEESPSLIHGDLWNGNFMIGSTGEPVLIDPAVYFAHREAEFGMTTLFGGFDRVFYEAYEEVWPLRDGAADRIAIYRLYHLLNHLNLFGSSYLSQCLEIMKKFA